MLRAGRATACILPGGRFLAAWAPGCRHCRINRPPVAAAAAAAPLSELDLTILQEALRREAAEEAADVAARESKRAAVQAYRQQLAVMMAKQEADDSEADARVQEAQRLQQGKQDADWAAREAARRKLMAEVNDIRQQQIAHKQQAR